MLGRRLRSSTALQRHDRGASAVEYALIAGVIALGLMGSVTDTREGMTNAYNAVVTALGGAVSTGPSAPQVPAPVVTGATVPTAARYGAGQSIEFTVSLDSEVTVTGMPRVPVTLGANTGGTPETVYANYVAEASGTTLLTFRYQVQDGDSDQDGVTVGVLDANGATIAGTGGPVQGLEAIVWGDTSGVKIGAAAGPAYSWGWGGPGTLGTGSNSSRTTPYAVAMPSGVTFTYVDAGGHNGCGIATDGVAYCWGTNENGELGIGTTGGSSNIPVSVMMPPGATFAQVSIGYNNPNFSGRVTCAVATSGAVYCWGTGNEYGQVGVGGAVSNTKYPAPTPVAMPMGVTFEQVSVGAVHVCALSTTGSVYCWGSGRVVGSTQRSTSPTLMAAPAGVTFTQVTSGRSHSCALAGNGSTYCWGDNYNSNLIGFTPAGGQVATIPGDAFVRDCSEFCVLALH